MQISRSAIQRPTEGSFPFNRSATSRRRQSVASLKTCPEKIGAVEKHQQHQEPQVWRSPGLYQAPDVLGHAYLRPEPPVTYTLRPTDISKQTSKRPWYPPSPYFEIPQLPPLVHKSACTAFEKRMRKVLPTKIKVTTSVDPLERYTSFQEIGTGVNGAVVRATIRRQPKIKVAIKRYQMHSDKTYQSAILRELKIMASQHPNLIRLREVVSWRDDLWIAMDLMRCSVFALLVQRSIPESYAVRITCQVLRGLIYLHAKGLIHRDIKCENLLLGRDGQVKLADFGLSTTISAQSTDRLGTHKWMAPELIRQEAYHEKIDMWSLGITVIEMMDRVPPHYLIQDVEELFDLITTEPSPTFSFSYPTIYMRGLVAWLLDDDPRTRPDAKAVLMELQRHIASNMLPCATRSELNAFIRQTLLPAL